MPELETDEPEFLGGTVQTYTRGDDLRDIIEKLKNHAHDCLDGQELEPAQMIIAAAQLIVDAESKLAELGVADDPYYEQSAHTRAGG